MGIFATRTRKGAHAGVVPDAATAKEARRTFARFAAVGELLAAGRDTNAACGAVGYEMARDGADLGEALDGLQATYARVLGGEPDFRAVRSLSLAWSEETLGYLHQLSCENPLTGLASLAHLRARLSEVYRGAEPGGTATATASHALVVADLPLLKQPVATLDRFESTLRLVRLAQSARLAFPGEETISQVNTHRIVILARRHDRLPERARLLRDLLEDLEHETGRARLWVEGLPAFDDGAGRLLDEITRA